MTLRILLCALVCLPFYQAPLQAGFWDNVKNFFESQSKPVPTIDVLIVNDSPGVMLEIKGNHQLYDPHKNSLISKRFIGKRKLIQPNSSGLKWGEEFPGIFQLQLIPEDNSITSVVDGVEYRGILMIYDIGGAISIVNRVPIEDYLRSTLPHVYPDPLLEETLAAIAIAQRTGVFYYAKNPKNKFWSVDGRKEGYRGMQSLEPDSPMEHAISATRHMVLSKTGAYEKTVTPFPALWSAQIGSQQGGGRILSRITVEEAEGMEQNGNHAAQILSRAFPGTHIELIY